MTKVSGRLLPQINIHGSGKVAQEYRTKEKKNKRVEL